ncbi:protein of unknown function (DU1801) [Micromonospora pattaloongensis]|uniref:YdhG-like domain-containing protein n=1 Tax=Micromonospora pattaloongensis TaxID=405436 RepID=A0A1H3H361_9ACTN|nr:DUF1801 domain-containing protein [Micromonospora pattaloongensis]SDY09827.1 protein of unknown function (DU1801) [Micromonospora pattaloongensis]
MPSKSGEVDDFMATLDHPLKAGVEELRSAILASNADISEHVKWNAPSFRYNGEDRVTFRLRPADRLQLIFHRGAKVRSDLAEFAFRDSTGLMTWLAPDRGVVTFPDLETIQSQMAAVVSLVNHWVRA